MANETYTIFDLGYDRNLTKDDSFYNEINRVATNIDNAINPALVGSGGSGGNVEVISGFYQSANFISGVSGWQLTPTSAEFPSIVVNGGTIRYGKIAFTDNVNAGYFIGNSGFYFGSATDVSYLKYNIGTGTLDYVGNISGRSSATLASAIDSSGHFVDANLNTSAKTILSNFTFGASGAIQIGTYVNGVSGDIRISPNGIVARNSAGANTITIDGTTGTITSLILTAGTITGVTITGGTIQTATSAKRIVMSSNVMEFYNSAGTNIASLNGGTLGSGGTFLYITSPSASPFDGLFIQQQGAGKSGITITCDDSGAGSEGLFIQNDGDASAQRILTNSTSAGYGLEFNYIGAGTAMLYGFNNSTTAIAAIFKNNHTSNSHNTVEIYKYGQTAGNALYCYVDYNLKVAGNFKQNALTSSHFARVQQLSSSSTDIFLWVSDGTDPNGTLSGTQGAVCYNCDGNGKIKYCSGGTVWV